MGGRSKLGDLEELALLCVRRLGERAEGAEIRAELEEVAGRSVSVSTVYVTLMRLEEKGYARSSLGEPTAERGGRARRHFAVTQEGLEALRSRREVRELLWRSGDAPEAGASGV